MPVKKTKKIKLTDEAVKKVPTRKKSVKKTKPEINPDIPQRVFININENDPALEAKQKIKWLIVGIFGMVIVAFWFLTLRNDIGGNKAGSNNLDELAKDISDNMKNFRGIIKDTGEAIGSISDDLAREQELQNLKSGVLQQIQVNLESEHWPEHISGILDLSIKYPTDWNKSESKESLIIRNSELATSTPAVSAEISITSFKNVKKLTVADWLVETKTDLTGYQQNKSEIFIDLNPAVRYDKIDTEKTDISYIIYVSANEKVYEIKVESPNGKDLFEPVINRIVSTIKFIK